MWNSQFKIMAVLNQNSKPHTLINHCRSSFTPLHLLLPLHHHSPDLHHWPSPYPDLPQFRRPKIFLITAPFERIPLRLIITTSSPIVGSSFTIMQLVQPHCTTAPILGVATPSSPQRRSDPTTSPLLSSITAASSTPLGWSILPFTMPPPPRIQLDTKLSIFKTRIKVLDLLALYRCGGKIGLLGELAWVKQYLSWN